MDFGHCRFNSAWIRREVWTSKIGKTSTFKPLTKDQILKMGTASKTIVWFRRDLRIDDNPALAAAARDGSILPVFIWCPKEEGLYYPGRVSRWWLKQSLIHLANSLSSLGASLVLVKTESTLAALVECVNAVGATKVVYNHLYGMFFFGHLFFIVNCRRIRPNDLHFLNF